MEQISLIKKLNETSCNYHAKLKGMAGNKSFFSIKRIAEAQAKLNLSWEVDDNIAIKTMESLKLMYNQYGLNTLMYQILMIITL